MTAVAFSARRLVSIRGFATVAVLTLAWCGLWQDVSVANIVSGGVLAVMTLGFGLGTHLQGGFRLRPLVRFIAVVAVDLVQSTVGVAREAVTPGDTTDEAIIEVNVGPEARRHFLLLIVCITLTPGTAVVDADPDTGAMYLHLLHYDKAPEVRAHVQLLGDLADQALPVSQQDAATKTVGSSL